jgi:hypothetical protein
LRRARHDPVGASLFHWSDLQAAADWLQAVSANEAFTGEVADMDFLRLLPIVNRIVIGHTPE